VDKTEVKARLRALSRIHSLLERNLAWLLRFDAAPLALVLDRNTPPAWSLASAIAMQKTLEPLFSRCGASWPSPPSARDLLDENDPNEAILLERIVSGEPLSASPRAASLERANDEQPLVACVFTLDEWPLGPTHSDAFRVTAPVRSWTSWVYPRLRDDPEILRALPEDVPPNTETDGMMAALDAVARSAASRRLVLAACAEDTPMSYGCHANAGVDAVRSFFHDQGFRVVRPSEVLRMDAAATGPRDVFPVRHPPVEIVFVSARTSAGAIQATLQAYHFEELRGERVVKDIAEQDVELGDAPRERLMAYLRGWKEAFPTLVDRFGPLEAPVCPADFVFPEVLGEPSAVTAEDFRDALLDPHGCVARRRESDAREAARFGSWEAPVDAATVRPLERSPSFEELDRSARAHRGLTLPSHVNVYLAFRASLDEAETELLTEYRVMTLQPLEHPFLYDPPEVLTLVAGKIDGWHAGLFYDDPRFLPAGLVSFHQRDGAGISWDGETLLDLFVSELAKVHAAMRDEGDERLPLVDTMMEKAHALRGANEHARRELRARALVPYQERQSMPSSPHIGVTALDAAGRPYHPVLPAPEVSRDGTAQLPPEMVEAHARSLGTDPAALLQLGRELWTWAWSDPDPTYRQMLLGMLPQAYEALGRTSFADLVRERFARRA
jgi:hypothetical protein